jgi:hypothetical protein
MFSGIRTLVFVLVGLLMVAHNPGDGTAGSSDGPAKEEVQKAVERGVAFLKSQSHAWDFEGHSVGVSALVGLALLECGVPSTDETIDGAAQLVRRDVASIDDTYDVSLAIMFLDRLGSPDDEALIETCCLRIVAGQSNRGGWGYGVPKITDDAQLRRLRTLLDKHEAARREKAEKGSPPAQADLMNNPLGLSHGRPGDDNSNTQFATLALWIARRHSVKTDPCLAAVETRFRRTQNPDGGWSYMAVARGGAPGGMLGSNGSMTCAGLLGLAVGYGVATEAVLRTRLVQQEKGRSVSGGNVPDVNRDQAIKHGLTFLAQIMEPGLAREANVTPDPNHARGFPGGRQIGSARAAPGWSLLHNSKGSEYYFLWSLERVAVIYGLDTIGNKDWYAIGAKYALEHQSEDGAWRGQLGEVVDTCFALFFFRRANLAGDLTATLRGKIRDPGLVSLRANRTERPAAKDDVAGASKSGNDKVDKEPSANKSESLSLPEAHARTPQTTPPLTPPSTLPVHSHRQEVNRLSDQLSRATAAERDALLEKIRDAKGSVNTDALAAAISRLDDAAKAKARDALTERLARMTASTLGDKMKDANSEIRRAAALACAMKEERAMVPQLIQLLDDSEPRVVRAAHAALKDLTGQKFGPADPAQPDERKQAIREWRGWWEKNQRK